MRGMNRRDFLRAAIVVPAVMAFPSEAAPSIFNLMPFPIKAVVVTYSANRRVTYPVHASSRVPETHVETHVIKWPEGFDLSRTSLR